MSSSPGNISQAELAIDNGLRPSERLENMIEACGLTKIFHGQKKRDDVVAVDNVSFTAECGEVYGLLGPNGAGKTTLVKLASTLIKATSGYARIANGQTNKDSSIVRELIGLCVGSERSFYYRLTGRQNLEFFGCLFGLKDQQLQTRVHEVLETLSIAKYADVLYMQYSAGTKRKLDIARALLTDPPVYIMDEPTTAIDPQSAIQIRQIISELRSAGKAILITTHNMYEADQLCDRLGIIYDGRLLWEGGPELLKRHVGRGEIVFSLSQESWENGALKALAGYGKVENNGTLTVTCGNYQPEVGRLVGFLGAKNANILNVAVEKPSLEKSYILFLEASRSV